jgi:hypothetical protein
MFGGLCFTGKILVDWSFEQRQDEQDIGNPGKLKQDS